MNGTNSRRRLIVSLGAAGAALVVAASASAHAHVSPPIVTAKQSQVFTLAVPTEKANLTTTKIELTPPQGFSIDAFIAAPGWKRTVQESGSGANTVVTKVTWEGGNVPTGEATSFEFLASTDASKTYTFGVKQTYSDGSVVDWSGPESSDAPAPTIEAKSNLGGGSSMLAVIALVVGALGLVLGIAALLMRSGGRTLA
jgi:uncharacterized protein YcnI